MRQKPYAAISVKDVVEAAQVGRTTFYRNFDSIDDILRLRCDQVFSGLIAYLSDCALTDDSESRTALLKPLLRYFYLHSEIIELLMLAERLDIVQASFRHALQPLRIQAAKRFDLDDDFLAYSQTIRIGFITSILAHWIDTGKKQAPDELADKLTAIIENPITLKQLLSVDRV